MAKRCRCDHAINGWCQNTKCAHYLEHNKELFEDWALLDGGNIGVYDCTDYHEDSVPGCLFTQSRCLPII